MKQIICLLLSLLMCLNLAQASERKKYPGGRHFIYRLTLTDKQESPYRLDNPTKWLSHKSLNRRRRQGLQLDSTDLPVSPAYIKTLAAQPGIRIVGKSRWNNTVLALSQDSATLHGLTALSFVRSAECVWISPDSIEKKTRKPSMRSSMRLRFRTCVKRSFLRLVF